MGGLPRSPHHLHDPPGTAQNPENRMKHSAKLLLELLTSYGEGRPWRRGMLYAGVSQWRSMAANVLWEFIVTRHSLDFHNYLN
jgi:hypothetical protein